MLTCRITLPDHPRGSIVSLHLRLAGPPETDPDAH